MAIKHTYHEITCEEETEDDEENEDDQTPTDESDESGTEPVSLNFDTMFEEAGCGGG